MLQVLHLFLSLTKQSKFVQKNHPQKPPQMSCGSALLGRGWINSPNSPWCHEGQSESWEQSISGTEIQISSSHGLVVALNGEEYRKPITEHTGNPTYDYGWRRVQETYHWAHRKPNLWLWIKKSRENLSLSTQETQPVTLNEEEYRKHITEHTGNPTCDSEWRRVQETHDWAHRKPNLWLWMEKSTAGNPSLIT